MKKLPVLLLLLLCILYSCDNSSDQEPSSPSGVVSFSFLNQGDDISPINGRILSNQLDKAKNILVSIINEDGTPTEVNSKKIGVYKLGEEYFVESILLPYGSFLLTEFLVLDEDENIIFATPVEGSDKADFVSDPLPIQFDISAPSQTKSIEIVSTDNSDLGQFGLIGITFDVVHVDEVLIAVLDGKNEVSTDSSVEVSITSADRTFEDQIRLNVVEKINFLAKSDVIDIEIKHPDFETRTISLGKDSLLSYATRPFIISLSPSEPSDAQGQLAHYIFSGDASDQSGNGNDGIAVGVEYTYDKNGEQNSALHFMGNGSSLEIPQVIKLWENQWTFSTWFKLEELPSTQSDAFLLTSKSVDYWEDVHLYVDDLDNKIKFWTAESEDKQPTSVTVEKNKWYMVTMTVDESFIKIYVNGQLELTVKNTSFTTVYHEGDPLIVSSIYSADSRKGRIHGVIDDLRVFNRAISDDEVGGFYNLEKGD